MKHGFKGGLVLLQKKKYISSDESPEEDDDDDVAESDFISTRLQFVINLFWLIKFKNKTGFCSLYLLCVSKCFSM